MKYFLITLCIILIIIAIYVISTYNMFVTWTSKIAEALSTMDIYLLKRSDLIPNIIATVKGYANYESDTLTKVVEARNKALTATTSSDKLEANENLSNALSKLLALTESYPDLKANNNFMDLQSTLKSVEAEIVNSRKYYNGVVREYNTKIKIIPSCFVAKMMKLETMPLYKMKDEAQRENVKVEF